jgi:hypothetical protein
MQRCSIPSSEHLWLILRLGCRPALVPPRKPLPAPLLCPVPCAPKARPGCTARRITMSLLAVTSQEMSLHNLTSVQIGCAPHRPSAPHSICSWQTGKRNGRAGRQTDRQTVRQPSSQNRQASPSCYSSRVALRYAPVPRQPPPCVEIPVCYAVRRFTMPCVVTRRSRSYPTFYPHLIPPHHLIPRVAAVLRHRPWQEAPPLPTPATDAALSQAVNVTGALVLRLCACLRRRDHLRREQTNAATAALAVMGALWCALP